MEFEDIVTTIKIFRIASITYILFMFYIGIFIYTRKYLKTLK